MMADRNSVFLHYAHENLNQVKKVYNGLKKRKVKVWFDKENLKIGRWKPQVLKAINRSKGLVMCLSHAAINKTSSEKAGFLDEKLQTIWEFAQEQDENGFTIIPVRLENCRHSMTRLSGWQQYDLFEDWEGVLDKLAVNFGGNSLSDAGAKDERTATEKILEGIMGKGVTYYYTTEYNRAITEFGAAIEIDPDKYEAWNNKGAALFDLDRYEEALEAFDKTIRIKPDDHKAWYHKGLALAELGRNEEALDALNKAIEFKPDMPEAWHHKGIVLAALGRFEEAMEIIKKSNLDLLRNEERFNFFLPFYTKQTGD